MTGVDDMSTQDVFGYFKEYPPAHIEWIDDASCECITHTHTRSSNSSSCSTRCSKGPQYSVCDPDPQGGHVTSLQCLNIKLPVGHVWSLVSGPGESQVSQHHLVVF